jgi:hypothetical protein
LDDGLSEVTFFYSMYGATIGSLSLQVLSNGQDWNSSKGLNSSGQYWNQVWAKHGDQGNVDIWQRAVIHVNDGSASFMRFAATTGSSWSGDISIDDVTVTRWNTPAPTITPVPTLTAAPTLSPTSSLDCSFDSDLCSYENTGNYSWLERPNTPTQGTGPGGDHTTGTGNFVYVESSSPNNPSAGPFYLEASVSSRLGQVTFYYSMNGAGCGELSVQTKTDDQWTTQWTKSGDQGTDWQEAAVRVESSDASRIRFAATTGYDQFGDIAIDDVSVTLWDSPLPSSSPGPTLSPMPTQAPSLMPSAAPTSSDLSTESQVQAAIFSGVPRLNIGADIFLSSTINIFEDLQFDGRGFTIDGQGAVRCFYITARAKVGIFNMTITGGRSDSYGGGLFVTGGAWVNMTHLLLLNNSCIYYGGGIYFESSSGLFTSCGFESNRA